MDYKELLTDAQKNREYLRILMGQAVELGDVGSWGRGDLPQNEHLAARWIRMGARIFHSNAPEARVLTGLVELAEELLHVIELRHDKE